LQVSHYGPLRSELSNLTSISVILAQVNADIWQTF
jgi:hypothetical protein